MKPAPPVTSTRMEACSLRQRRASARGYRAGVRQDTSARQDTGLTTAVARRLTRHSSVYAIGFGTTLAFSFVNVAVLTRFIDPASFGKLAVLLIFAALLTVLYNLGSLQGAFHAAYGSSDDGDGDDDDRTGAAGVGDRGAALTTALLLTGLIAGAGTLLVALAAPNLSQLLLGNREDGDLVLLAAASGGMGSLWRLLSNVPRLERRPTAYVVLSNLRPVLVLGISLPLVIEGAHVAGVLIGTAAGTAASVGLALIVCRRNFALAVEPSLVLPMLRWGLPFVPLIVSFWVIHNVDLFILSDVASSREVGLYRVASRIASVASYFLSSFLMAWTPLRRTSLFIAAEEETAGGIRSTIVTYFALGSMGLLVLLTTGADVLIHVAGPAYADAAGLIPVLGLAFVAYGGFVVTYRAVRFPRRRPTYVVLAALAAVVFVIAALLLTPPLGGYGAALAPVIAFTLATAALVVLSSRGPAPLPFDVARIAGAMRARRGLHPRLGARRRSGRSGPAAAGLRGAGHLPARRRRARDPALGPPRSAGPGDVVDAARALARWPRAARPQRAGGRAAPAAPAGRAGGAGDRGEPRRAGAHAGARPAAPVRARARLARRGDRLLSALGRLGGRSRRAREPAA